MYSGWQSFSTRSVGGKMSNDRRNDASPSFEQKEGTSKCTTGLLMMIDSRLRES